MGNRSGAAKRVVVGLMVASHITVASDAAGALCLSREASSEPWASATKRDADGRPVSRFVPPELYSGATWTGDRKLEIRAMKVTRKPAHPHDHPSITITAPHRDDESPDIVTLRRERYSGRKGTVTQAFRINERGDGLGRISDVRRDRVRRMNECFKFPLGEWRQGEERRCRGSVIRIIEIDFEHNCVAHALKFRWNDEGTYIFAPGHGMVSTDAAEE